MGFGEHLAVFRKSIIQILIVVCVLSAVIFIFKETVFNILLAPKNSEFITYRYLSDLADALNMPIGNDSFNVRLINTDISAQFMIHLTSSITLGFLLSSPYIMVKLFGFVSPALYSSEKRFAIKCLSITASLFMAGLAVGYFIIFPVSFRFLATYQVSSSVENIISIESYFSSLLTTLFLCGITFLMPIVVFILARHGILEYSILKKYRKHVLVLMMALSAIITPPDVFSMFIMTVPLYMLYELSILVISSRQTKLIAPDICRHSESRS